jgi:hypothetical protein
MQNLLVTIVLLGAFTCSAMAIDKPLSPVQRQMIELGKESVRYNFSVYASRAMNSDMSRIRHIVIIQHGLQRNALDYFNAGMRLMIASGVSKDLTLLIAPDFFATPDIGADDPQRFPFWKVMGWPGGEDSINAPHVSSFRVFDDLLTLVADKAHFPSLTSVVIAGHSDGAAFVQRYAVLNKVHRKFQSAGVDLRYVIANSPSYLYFTPERPTGHSFALYNSGTCSSYNDYRYGTDRIIPYAGGRSGQQLFVRYASRDVTYLLGAEDKDPNHRVLDKSCGAEAQGSSRLKRGLAYIRYEHYLADRQINLKRHAYEVIGVGHSYEDMFASRCGLNALFGLPDEKVPAGAVCRDVTQLSPTVERPLWRYYAALY